MDGEKRLKLLARELQERGFQPGLSRYAHVTEDHELGIPYRRRVARATLIAGSEVRFPRPGLLADLLDEGLRATSVRALVIHDLYDQPRLRVLA